MTTINDNLVHDSVDVYIQFEPGVYSKELKELVDGGFISAELYKEAIEQQEILDDQNF